MSLLDEAREKLKGGQIEEGIAALREHLRAQPADAAALHLLVRALGNAHRWTEAEAEARRLKALRPQDPAAWSSLGTTLRKRGKYTEARNCQHRALSLDSACQWAQEELQKIARDEAHEAGSRAEGVVGESVADLEAQDRATPEGWYVRLHNGEMAGPLTLDDFETLIREGVVGPQDRCRYGNGPAHTVEDVLGLRRVRDLVERPYDKSQIEECIGEIRLVAETLLSELGSGTAGLESVVELIHPACLSAAGRFSYPTSPAEFVILEVSFGPPRAVVVDFRARTFAIVGFEVHRRGKVVLTPYSGRWMVFGWLFEGS